MAEEQTGENTQQQDGGALKKQLEESEKTKEEYLAGWQRAKADFLNYKKEELERMTGMLEWRSEEILLKILPIGDNLERAAREVPADQKNSQIIQGFLQIIAQFKELLKSQGVEELKTLRERFDPAFHEAVEEVDGAESGIIVEEIQKGYLLNGKLLRPAKVKVSN